MDGGIKGVARQGFGTHTHTLPRALPQGALDARTHACVSTLRRLCALRFAIFDRKKSRKAKPISTISLSAGPGFHLARHLLRSCRIGLVGLRGMTGGEGNEAATCQTAQMKALRCPERIRGSVGFHIQGGEKEGNRMFCIPD